MRRAAWSVLVTVAALAFGASGAEGAGWVGEPFPNPFLISNQVFGVSCATATACEAVGGGFDAHWNGHVWEQQSDPGGGSFDAVSCPRARFCVAVGNGVAGHFDGVTWSLDPFPISASAVSCSRRAFCLAVGDSAAVWDGTAWTVQSPPVGGLSGVSCRAHACTAVGGTTAERFAGGSWTVQTTAAPTGASGYSLSGVSCPRTTFCVGVGDQSTADGSVVTLAEIWNGSVWSIVPTPTPLLGTPGFTVFATLLGVSCHTTRFCVATGVQTALDTAPAVFAELWDGTAWHLIPGPFGDQAAVTSGGSVSCPTSTRCQAVGYTAIPVSTASFNLAAEFHR